MASSFGQYQNGIAPVTGISEAGGNIGRTYMGGMSNFTNALTEGLSKYSEGLQKNKMADQEIESLGNAIKSYHDMIGDDPELHQVASGLIPTIEELSNASTKGLPQKLAILNAAKAKWAGMGEELKTRDWLNQRKLNRDIQGADANEPTSETVINPAIADPKQVGYSLESSVGDNTKNVIAYYNGVKSQYGASAKLKPLPEFIADWKTNAIKIINDNVKNPQLKAFHIENLNKSVYVDYLKERQARGEELDDSDLLALKEPDTYTNSVFDFNTPVATGTAGASPTPAVTAPKPTSTTTTALTAPASATPATAPTNLPSPSSSVPVAQEGMTPDYQSYYNSNPPTLGSTSANQNSYGQWSFKPQEQTIGEALNEIFSKPSSVKPTAPAQTPVIKASNKPTDRQLANAQLAVDNYNKRILRGKKEGDLATTIDSGQTADLKVWGDPYSMNFLNHYGINIDQFLKVNPAFRVTSAGLAVKINDKGMIDENGNNEVSVSGNGKKGLNPQINSASLTVKIPQVALDENGNPTAVSGKTIKSFDELPDDVKAKFETQKGNGKGSVQKIIEWNKSGGSQQTEQTNTEGQPVSTLPPLEQFVNPFKGGKMAMAVPVIPAILGGTGAPEPVKAGQEAPKGLPAPAKKEGLLGKKTGLLEGDSIGEGNKKEEKLSSHAYKNYSQDVIDKLQMIRDEVNDGNFEGVRRGSLLSPPQVWSRMNPALGATAEFATDQTVDAFVTVYGGKVVSKLAKAGINKNVIKETEKIWAEGLDELKKLGAMQGKDGKWKIVGSSLSPEKKKQMIDAIKSVTESTAAKVQKQAAGFYGASNPFLTDLAEGTGMLFTGVATQFGLDLDSAEKIGDKSLKYGLPTSPQKSGFHVFDNPLDKVKEKEIWDIAQKAYQGLHDADISGDEQPTASQLQKVKTSIDTAISKLQGVKNKHESKFNELAGIKTSPVGSNSSTAQKGISQNGAPVEKETLPVSSVADAINMGTVTYEQPVSSISRKESIKSYIKSKYGYIPSGFDAGYKALHPEDDLKFSETPYGTAMWTGGKWEMIKTGNVRTLAQQGEDQAVTFGTPDRRGGLVPAELVANSGFKLAGIFAGSVSDASKFRVEYNKLLRARSFIKELQEINDQPAESLNPATRGRAEILVNQLITMLRTDLIGVGTVSNYEQEMLAKIVENPANFLQIDSSVREKYNQLARGIEDSLINTPTIHGLSVIKTGRDLKYEQSIRGNAQKASGYHPEITK